MFDSPYYQERCKNLENGRVKRSKERRTLQQGSIPERVPSGGLSSDAMEWSPPRHTMVSAAGFRLSAREAELFAFEISECSSDEPKIVESSTLEEYQDLQGAFSEEASNRLPEHGTSDMKIEFIEGQEPRNAGLRPMSPMELEELRKYLEENLGMDGFEGPSLQFQHR